MEKKVLIKRWLRDFSQPTQILDGASISLVREQVRELGREHHLPPQLIEEMALIASELGTNQLRHARMGAIGVRRVDCAGVPGLEVAAADLGPGIEDIGGALEGRQSASGSLGSGLSAVFRLSDKVDFDVRIGEGTCIWARKLAKPSPLLVAELALLGRPCPGEAVSGDDGAFVRNDTGFTAALADGLGHGPLAREASAKAIQFTMDQGGTSLDRIICDAEEAVVNTRGSTLGVARFDGSARILCFAGAGDLSAQAYHLKSAKYFPTSPFTLGQGSKRRAPRPEEYAVNPGSVFVMFSDGLKSGATLHTDLRIRRMPAISIAQHLLETFARSNDDALVFVAKFGSRLR